MRHLIGTIVGTCVLWGSAILSGWAQDAAGPAVPRLIRFSGVVQPVGEKPLRGVVELSFSLYAQESGGEPLWFESQTVEVDALGRYNVLLGAMHADGLPMDLFTSGEARWLSIMVGKVEQPRVLLVSVPYALKAGDAESLGGKPAASYVATDQLKSQVESTLSDPKLGVRTANTVVMASSGGGDTPSAIVETNPSTFTCSTAGTCVTVTQNGAGLGLVGVANGTTAVIQGVRGVSASTSGRGVYGQATATSGVTQGVRGDTASPTGYGVYGVSTSLTGLTYGLVGLVSSNSGVGLLGRATHASGATIGLRGIADSANGTAGVFENRVGGKIISGVSAGLVEKFSVNGSGNVVAAGSITGASASFTGAVSGGAFTGTSFTGNGSGLTNVNATTLDGIDSSAFAPASGSAAYVSRLGDIMAGTLVLPGNGLTVGGSQMVLTSGRVGVGTINPNAQLHVAGTNAADGGTNGAAANIGFTATAGDGGDGTSTGGNGGSLSLTGGRGGASTDGNGGLEAILVVQGANGGGVSVGGNGGSIVLTPGEGGTSTGTPGSAGNVLLAPTGSGKVGIGTNFPLDTLHVAGEVRVTNCVKDSTATEIAGTCASDLRFKTNVLAYPAVLAKLVQLNPVTFNWKSAEFPERHFGTQRSFGLIAQEVEKVFPDMVTEDDKGFKAVKYHKLPMLMLQGIRELKSENDALKTQVGELSERLTAVLARLEELESARK